MNNISNSLTGVLFLKQKGGVRLLRGANNVVQSLDMFSNLPTWPYAKKGKINRMPTLTNETVVVKNVTAFSPSNTSLRQQFPKKFATKNAIWSQEELLIAAIMDWSFDTFGSLTGVSFSFETNNFKIQMSYNSETNNFS